MPANPPRPNRWLYIILIIMIAGFIVTIYFTIANIYVPVNQEVVTATNDDIFVVVTKESNIAVPISNFFS
jgi:hypothetical protein